MGIFDKLFGKKNILDKPDNKEEIAKSMAETTTQSVQSSDWDMNNEYDKSCIRDLVYNQDAIRDSQAGNIFSLKIKTNSGEVRPLLYTTDTNENLEEIFNAIALPSTFRYNKVDIVGIIAYTVEFITNRYLSNLQTIYSMIESRPGDATVQITLPTTSVRECLFIVPTDTNTLKLLLSQNKCLLILVEESFSQFKWIEINVDENMRSQITACLGELSNCFETSDFNKISQAINDYYSKYPVNSLLFSDLEQINVSDFDSLKAKLEEKFKMFGIMK